MNSYQIIEDNAGGLYLFVFDDANVCGGIINLEYADAGEYNQVAEGLSVNPLTEIAGWDGHMDDAAATYAEVTSSEFGWAIVNNNGDLSTHKMGTAAQRYFGIKGALCR